MVLGGIASWLMVDLNRQNTAALLEREAQDGRAMAIRQRAEQQVLAEQQKAREAEKHAKAWTTYARRCTTRM